MIFNDIIKDIYYIIKILYVHLIDNLFIKLNMEINIFII